MLKYAGYLVLASASGLIAKKLGIGFHSAMLRRVRTRRCS